MMRSSVCIATLLTLCLVSIGATASRLREKPINLLRSNASTGASENSGYSPRHLSGYFKLDRTYAAEMFYFFFEHRESNEGPLILWMTGGPGCSSELAVFYENGPFHVNKNLTLRENPYGWDKAGSIIYVDQPINTGFSYSTDDRDRVYDEKVVAADMIDFFTAFMEAHPEFRDRELYVTGESFAGHYVPAVSYALFLHSQKYNNTGLNLKGLAIGNGLTDPVIQYGQYAPFAYKNGLISKSLEQGMKTVYPLCRLGINACNTAGIDFICRATLAVCQVSQFSPILAAAGNVNVYDIRKPCVGVLCYDFSRLDRYLAQTEVRKELGVGDRKWAECNFDVNYDMQGDFMKNYDDLVAKLLEVSDVRVMIYTGVKDLICNWLGNEKWLDQLPWSNLTSFQTAPELDWNVAGQKAGTVRSVPRLSFVKIANAGHMSPMDQPENTLDMITHFLQNKDIVPPSVEASHLQREEAVEMMSSNAFRLRSDYGVAS